MEAVAAGDEVAFQLVAFAVLDVTQLWPSAVDLVRRHRLGLVDRLQARRGPGLHEIAGDLGLAVDGDRPSGQGVQVDAVAGAPEAHLDAFVNQALRVEAIGDAGLLEKGDGAMLDQAGPDPAQDIVAAAALEDHIVDPGGVQQLAEQ